MHIAVFNKKDQNPFGFCAAGAETFPPAVLNFANGKIQNITKTYYKFFKT